MVKLSVLILIAHLLPWVLQMDKANPRLRRGNTEKLAKLRSSLCSLTNCQNNIISLPIWVHPVGGLFYL